MSTHKQMPPASRGQQRTTTQQLARDRATQLRASIGPKAWSVLGPEIQRALVAQEAMRIALANAPHSEGASIVTEFYWQACSDLDIE